MFEKQDRSKSKAGLLEALNLKAVSEFFYQNSNVLTAILMTVIFVGYLLLVMTSKAVGFETDASSIRSLGTSFGFDQSDIMAFLAARTDEMIDAYITFNQIWDVFFGLIYGLMYVVWVSVLFKPIVHKAGRLNLLPLVQVAFDWLENYELALLANQYLAEGMIASSNAQLASVFSMIKWGCSAGTYTVIFVGIILLILRAFKTNKFQE